MRVVANENKKKSQLVSTRLKKERMLHAMKKSLGNISASTRYAQISRNTHYRWLKVDIKYKDDIVDINNRAIDFVEAQLFKLIANGNERSIQFYLNCKGKDRGYGKVSYKSMPVRREPKNDLKNKTIEELQALINKQE